MRNCVSTLCAASLLLTGVLGCAKARHESGESLVAAPMAMGLTARAEKDSAQDPTGQAGRKIIRTGSQQVEVDGVEAAAMRTQEIVERSGGYVESSTLSERTGHLELRVPSKGLAAVMNQIAAVGEEKSRSFTGEDVTGEYVDLQARLKNNLALRDRLKALLKQAKDVKDILAIEVELNRLQSEIDAQEARLKSIDKMVDLSRLSVTLSQERTLGPIGWVGYGVGWVLSKLIFWD